MSEPFLAEIRLFGFGFPPRGWAQCDGQILPIAQNQSLYALLGPTFGGDGRTTFALPDLRGRLALHPDGAGDARGAHGGAETHALTVDEIPSHTHSLEASNSNAASASPTGNVLARSGQSHYRTPADGLVAMQPASVATSGSGQGHENMQPFLTVNFCIALRGVFPSRN